MHRKEISPSEIILQPIHYELFSLANFRKERKKERYTYRQIYKNYVIKEEKLKFASLNPETEVQRVKKKKKKEKKQGNEKSKGKESSATALSLRR